MAKRDQCCLRTTFVEAWALDAKLHGADLLGDPGRDTSTSASQSCHCVLKSLVRRSSHRSYIEVHCSAFDAGAFDAKWMDTFMGQIRGALAHCDVASSSHVLHSRKVRCKSVLGGESNCDRCGQCCWHRTIGREYEGARETLRRAVACGVSDTIARQYASVLEELHCCN
eukprot:1382983-Amphidinium_carterae.1